jgi:hypothetical protein
MRYSHPGTRGNGKEHPRVNARGAGDLVGTLDPEAVHDLVNACLAVMVSQQTGKR